MAAPRVTCLALEGCDVGARVWRQRGALHVAVVVKATLTLVQGKPMTLTAPEPVLAQDRHHDDSPAQSLRAPQELVPWRRRVDVTAHGFACTAGGEALPATTVRLAVFRGQQSLLDKTLYVYGDRALGADGQPGSPTPMTRLPLVYERALHSDANPNGVRPGKRVPNVVDPKHQNEAAGFGPISRYAKARRALLGDADRKRIEGDIAELPDAFDGAYFQAAPADQQLAQLHGDEWVILDGFDAEHRRVASQLPRLWGQALVTAVDAAAAQSIGLDAPLTYRPLRLAIDALHVDGETGKVTVTWRGSLRVADDAALSSLRVVGGVSTAEAPCQWPAPASLAEGQAKADASAEPATPDAARTDETAAAGTGTMAPATPFLRGASPWGSDDIKPIPQVIGTGTVTYADASGQTMTLSADARAAIMAALPFAQEVIDGTRALSVDDVPSGSDAPFDLAAPGSGRPSAAPAGAPYAQTPAAAIPKPVVGATTSDIGPGSAEPPSAVVAQAVEASRFFHELPRSSRDTSAPDAAEPAPVVPPRTTEGIRLVNATPLHLAYVPWQHRPPRDSLTVIVKGTYDIVPGARARPRDDMEPHTGDLTQGDVEGASLRYPSDFAYFKSRADVVMTGFAYPPAGDRGRAGLATEVRLRFGDDEHRIDRRVAVFGERSWTKALFALAPTDPTPFERMPLVYERAFGGTGWGPNPVGVGKGAEAGADGVARLPNLEQPDELIDSPGDTPRPACFGPVHPLWGPRWRALGRYDRAWLRERWPYFPEDFDWSHFQCAPPEQRVEVVAADAPFTLTGVHPEHTHLTGQLPGVTPRCFVATTGDEAGAPGADIAFEEVLLRLDTVVIDADAMTLTLVWRGLLEVSDEHAPEIQAMFLMQDEGETVASTEAAYARFLAEVTPKEPLPEVTDPDADADASPANDVVDEPDEALAAVEARIEAQQAEIATALEAAGLPPLDPVALEGAPPTPMPMDAEALAASLRQAGVVDSEVAEVLAALEDDHETPDDPPAPRARAEAMLAGGARFDGEDFAGADLSGLDFGGRSMTGCDLRGAKLVGARLSGADLTGALLSEADLTDADVTGAELTLAELMDTTLTRTRLDGAVLHETDLTGCHGEAPSFASVQGHRTRFDEARLPGARFDAGRLSAGRFDGAELQGASFEGAALVQAVFFGTRAEGASFKGADLTDLAGDGADVAEANFFRANAKGSTWEEARMTKARMLEAIFDDATFVKANLDDADLSACALREVRMKRVSAERARFVKSDLQAAQLERANLRAADFTGASLYAAAFFKTNVEAAIFTDAHLALTQLEGRG